ncbi:MAG: hypothetical protein QOJ22_1126 [Thermoleophilaceae bacterium]|jgi:hypothetical protein|nr:hypothetical protein [Thermoleophilaceae bacterium]
MAMAAPRFAGFDRLNPDRKLTPRARGSPVTFGSTGEEFQAVPSMDFVPALIPQEGSARRRAARVIR